MPGVAPLDNKHDGICPIPVFHSLLNLFCENLYDHQKIHAWPPGNLTQVAYIAATPGVPLYLTAQLRIKNQPTQNL